MSGRKNGLLRIWIVRLAAGLRTFLGKNLGPLALRADTDGLSKKLVISA
jgi:hypothetical protein